MINLIDNRFNLEKKIRSKSLKELKSFCNHYDINIKGKFTKKNLRFIILNWFEVNYGY